MHTCEGLEVIETFHLCVRIGLQSVNQLKHFDNQRINLLCGNNSPDEIYSPYKRWHDLSTSKTGEGNVIAEEQVMYFGIAGTSYHSVLEMVEPMVNSMSGKSVEVVHVQIGGPSHFQST